INLITGKPVSSEICNDISLKNTSDSIHPWELYDLTHRKETQKVLSGRINVEDNLVFNCPCQVLRHK
ncbi:MAG: hypothetical protein KJ714_10440, partial [Euryarchaeota archaeon]|nr:hypothetical protein [Euryarchaeota archaeon]